MRGEEVRGRKPIVYFDIVKAYNIVDNFSGLAMIGFHTSYKTLLFRFKKCKIDRYSKLKI